MENFQFHISSSNNFQLKSKTHRLLYNIIASNHFPASSVLLDASNFNFFETKINL